MDEFGLGLPHCIYRICLFPKIKLSLWFLLFSTMFHPNCLFSISCSGHLDLGWIMMNPGRTFPSLNISRSAEMDKLGSMLEKKWEKVKPRCTSLKMTGIKAGYGVSKKKELEDTVVCDDGGKPESKDQEWRKRRNSEKKECKSLEPTCLERRVNHRELCGFQEILEGPPLHKWCVASCHHRSWWPVFFFLPPK